QSGKGRASSAETGNRKGYAGYEWDHVITMSHVRHRVYWAEIGRWTRRDPLGYVDTPSLYAFCRHSPISRTDESGLYSDKIGEFYACREKCGLFRCIRAVLIGMDAKDAALKKYPGESQGDSRADAWRHCVWNCNMTIKLGFNCAKIVGDNHERGRMGPADQMDLHNNAIGRAIGMRGQNCSDGCTEANDNGQLITTPPTKAAPNGPGIDYDYNYKGYGCLWG
ncbi:MAG: RHS repeat-associated core domain-containing protein, partial [Phycisphaeraceae bacterium]|nr:RHS repeat-associated core domain-containing protein [Phycisphaeraceae bacterium]